MLFLISVIVFRATWRSQLSGLPVVFSKKVIFSILHLQLEHFVAIVIINEINIAIVAIGNSLIVHENCATISIQLFATSVYFDLSNFLVIDFGHTALLCYAKGVVNF